MTLLDAPRAAITSTPILDVLTERWSPRAFDPDSVLEAGALAGAFEAARWAPSAGNSQPWRFIIARRGTKSFSAIADTLMGFNQAWAGSAAALVVNVAITATEDGTAVPYALYDLGQAVAQLSVQAHAEGLHVHQMGGFDRAAISAAFDLEERFAPTSVMTIGKIGDAGALPDVLREREVAPRERLSLDEIVLRND